MKNVFWLAVAALLISGGVWFWKSQDELTLVTRIPLSPASFPAEQAAMVVSELQNEIQKSQVVMMGLWWHDPEASALQVALTDAIRTQLRIDFDLIWQDEGITLSPPGRQVYLFGRRERLVDEVSAAIAEGKRLLIVTSPAYASSFIENSPAWQLAQAQQISMISLVTSRIPRRREQEKEMFVPCVLPHKDETGLGALGCRLQQIARLYYRQSFVAGEKLTVLEQITPRDFIMGRADEMIPLPPDQK